MEPINTRSMKSHLLKFKLIVFLVSSVILQTNAQCTGGSSLVTVSYDTTGMGTGNDSYIFTLPKFNPALGTLMSVSISSDVQVNYIYSIGNTRFASALFKTRILRTDDINSNAMDPMPISVANQTALLNTIVPGNTTVQVGPSLMNYSVSGLINDDRVVNFLGAGNVDFTYDNTSYVAFSGPSGSNVDFTQLYDTLHFKVSYNYCTASALDLNLFNFMATIKAGVSCLLSWQQQGDEQDKNYFLERSSNGIAFNTLVEMPANHPGNYSYLYTPGKEQGQRLFFRLRQVGSDINDIKYSEIRAININNDLHAAMQLYSSTTPNKFELIFGSEDDRKIILYSMTGQVVWTNIYKNSSAIHLQLPVHLSRGVYVAINLRSNHKDVTKVLLQ